jgi:hypothetical protein
MMHIEYTDMYLRECGMHPHKDLYITNSFIHNNLNWRQPRYPVTQEGRTTLEHSHTKEDVPRENMNEC